MAKSAEEIKPIVEALLFASDKPLTPRKLADLAEGTDARAVRKAVEMLNEEYEREGRAFRIEEIAGGFQMLSRPEFRRWVTKLHRTQFEWRLSSASLETLAIIAYKQPILRAEVEAIRGVQSGEVIRGLLERGLVKAVGRKNTIGRPILYGTTRKFLEYFGLKSLKDLPPMGSPEQAAAFAPTGEKQETERSHEEDPDKA